MEGKGHIVDVEEKSDNRTRARCTSQSKREEGKHQNAKDEISNRNGWGSEEESHIFRKEDVVRNHESGLRKKHGHMWETQTEVKEEVRTEPKA